MKRALPPMPRQPFAPSVALAALALALPSACRSSDAERASVERGGWRADVAHVGDTRLSGVACGDIDPASPGDELIAVGDLGQIVYARCRAGVFESSVVEATGGELLQVAVGDVDRARPGAEVVTVGVLTGAEDDGAEGVAWLLARRPDGTFERTELFRTGALLHAVVIADLDPRAPGNEVALAGFTREVTLLARVDGAFVPRTIATLPGNAKGLAATANGLVVACDDGSLLLLARPTDAAGDGAWTVARSWQQNAPLARVATRAGELLVCSNDGVLNLHQTAGGGGFSRTTTCLQLDDRLRGAVFADVDPRVEGSEAATAGYDGTVRVVRLTPWPVADDLVPVGQGLVNYRVESEIVADDTARLHHLATGRFDGLGTALVTAGYSGRVLVVHRVAEANAGR